MRYVGDSKMKMIVVTWVIVIALILLLSTIAICSTMMRASKVRSSDRVVVVGYATNERRKNAISPPNESDDVNRLRIKDSLPKPWGNKTATFRDDRTYGDNFLMMCTSTLLVGKRYEVTMENNVFKGYGTFFATSPGLPVSITCWFDFEGRFNFVYMVGGNVVRRLEGHGPFHKQPVWWSIIIRRTDDELYVSGGFDAETFDMRGLPPLPPCELFFGTPPPIQRVNENFRFGTLGMIRNVRVNGVSGDDLRLYSIGPFT